MCYQVLFYKLPNTEGGSHILKLNQICCDTRVIQLDYSLSKILVIYYTPVRYYVCGLQQRKIQSATTIRIFYPHIFWPQSQELSQVKY